MSSNPPTAIIYSATSPTSYRHASITAGITLLTSLCHSLSLNPFPTESPAKLGLILPSARLLIFLHTAGDTLDDNTREAIRKWLCEGKKGWVGIHAAATAEPSWGWFGAEVLGGGAWFASHPPLAVGTLHVCSDDHVSVQHLGETWEVEDEWYRFKADPESVHTKVLAKKEDGEAQVWCGEVGRGGGRRWYTALGHTDEIFENEKFVKMVEGGMRWCLRMNEEIEVKLEDLPIVRA